MAIALQVVLFIMGGLAIAATALSLIQGEHWLLRSWDFPRIQVALLAALAAVGYALPFLSGQWYEWLYIGVLGICAVWQIIHILPYTILAPRMTMPCAPDADADGMLRLLVSNLDMDNHQHKAILERVRREQPDVVVLVEVTPDWREALKPLEAEFEHVIAEPREYAYGMMVLSHLPLIEGRVRHLVQEDVPSIHATVELRCGRRVRVIAIHPRPPEPIRDQDAAPRDAELVVVGREIAEKPGPTLVAGDLNDVAWSHTTRLFLRLSGLLDPRRGRGLYNSFHARNPVLRFPLDHVFHSDCFRLSEMRRLEAIGSDHFPMLIQLSYESDARAEQSRPQEEGDDEADAREKIEEAGKEATAWRGGRSLPNASVRALTGTST